MRVSSIWHLFNLRDSPYSQNRLGIGAGFRLDDLFVGRSEEYRCLKRVISDSDTSRQAITAPPGFGKATFAEYIKRIIAQEGYLASDRTIVIRDDDDATTILIKMVRYIYESIIVVSSDPYHPALVRLRRFIREVQSRKPYAIRSANGSGMGARVIRTEGQSTALIQNTAFELVSQLMALARAEFRGVFLHVNFEKLTSTGVSGAIRSFRDIHETFLTVGLHTLFVGPPRAIGPMVFRHPQMRSILGSITRLDPLPTEDVQELLARRYEALRLEANRPITSPVHSDAVEQLYPLFAGNLRQFLRALDLACFSSLGYTDPPNRSLELEEIKAILAPIYRAEAAKFLNETLLQYLTDLCTFGEDTFTQQELVVKWKVTQGAVSMTLSGLHAAGYVREVGRIDRKKAYQLTAPVLIPLSLER